MGDPIILCRLYHGSRARLCHLLAEECRFAEPWLSPVMAADSGASFSSRRHACNRCRTQKLRCERNRALPLSAPCVRCHRAGSRCYMADDEQGPLTPAARNKQHNNFDFVLDPATYALADGATSEALVARRRERRAQKRRRAAAAPDERPASRLFVPRILSTPQNHN